MEFKVGFSLFKTFPEAHLTAERKALSARNHFTAPARGPLLLCILGPQVLDSSQPHPHPPPPGGQEVGKEEHRARGGAEQEGEGASGEAKGKIAK